jgi:hypothetical protein
MSADAKFSIHTDVKFPPLERIDVQQIVSTVRGKWFNQTLCQVNEAVVRLGVLEGEFIWHRHDREDEFFYVVDGKLLIDLEGRTVELTVQQGFVEPGSAASHPGPLPRRRPDGRTCHGDPHRGRLTPARRIMQTHQRPPGS